MKTFIKENWLKIIVVVIAIILVSLISKFFAHSRVSLPTTKPATENTADTQIANPASVNCVENGGKPSIIDKLEGQVGMCTLPDGTVCEEWAYFRGECLKK